MRIPLFQYYRVVAAYLVLLIHQQFWKTGMVMGEVKNLAVPIFAAMAGYLFVVGEDRGLGQTLVGKAKRILLPYVVWAVIYFVANNVVLDGWVKHGTITIPGIRSWLLGGTACHLWFLPCLFVTFVCAALLRLWFPKTIGICVLLFLGFASQFLPGETSATSSGYCRIYFGRLLFFFAVGGLVTLVKFGSITASMIGWGLIMMGYINLRLDMFTGLC